MGGENFPSDSKATKAPMEQETVPLIARTKTHRHATNGVQLMSGMVILIAIASVIAMCVHNGYDNDIWFILATGRRIAEHGIPYTNPFSVYQGMAFVAQQWLVCLIDWLIWSASGFVGLGVLLLAECIILLLSMRRAIASASGTDKIGIGALCLMLLVMSAASSYISFRPQVITMTLMTLTISVMERYRKTNDARTLGWLLPITVLHANLHMSMMWMDVAIVCCYAMPPARCLNRAFAWLELGYRRIALLLDDDVATGTRRERMIDTLPTTWHVQFIEDGYERVPMLKALAMMLVATCANPYGISGATYLFASYGAAGYGDYISEMGRVTPLNASYGIQLVACIVIAAIAIGRRGLRRADFPMLLVVLGTIPVSLAHIRSVWILPVISLPYVAKTLAMRRGGRTRGYDGIGSFGLLRNIILTVTITLCTTLAVVSIQSLTNAQYQDDSSTPITAMDTLDRIYDESQRGDIKICTMFNLGGFVEYHGYRVSMDPRPETWQDSISHDGNDRYTTYVDAANSVSDADRILASCDFDYVLASSDSTLKQEAERKGYTEVVSGVGYVLLGKNGS